MFSLFYPQGKSPLTPTGENAGWTSRWPGQRGKGKKSLPLLGTEFGFSGYAAHSLVTTLTELSVSCSPLINLEMQELITPHKVII